MRSLVVVTIVLGTCALAWADEQTDPEKADKIFEEAQKLKQAGKTAEACAKYDEALHYNRSAVGTLLNVALCDEEQNKVASALELFMQARDLAREHNLNEHRAAAEEHILKIEPLVPHLTISFAEIAAETKLVIDDKVYPITGANDIRIDPGTRHVVVTAPGRLPYETTIELKAQEKKSVEIPKLKPPVTVKRARVTIGKIVTFSGVGLIATGIVIGVVARGRYNEQFDNGNCTKGDPPQCNPDGYQRTGNALTLGTVGTVVGISGGVAVALGAYLWFFAPKEQEQKGVAFVPTLSPESAGIAAVGRF
ncbi:MAG TPA: tetratricopeptide repeat protein [Kofleriaceae bacterium]|nr:tetratricopeptide repeat protein [Kofleriaceae bacterium]